MKKIVVTLALLGAVAYSYGQGTVAMGNSSALVSLKTSLAAPAAVLPTQASGMYRFAAFYAPPSSTAIQLDPEGKNWADVINSLAGWTLLQQGVNSASTAGRITWTAATPAVPGFGAGSDVSLFITAWSDAGAMATWDLAKVGNPVSIGSSEYIKVMLGGGTTPNSSVWGGDVGAYFASGPITLVPGIVPEPSSLALAGLGAAALLIFRRRN